MQTSALRAALLSRFEACRDLPRLHDSDGRIVVDRIRRKFQVAPSEKSTKTRKAAKA